MEKYIEKEIKLKIDKPRTLIRYLMKRGAKLLNRSRENTIRFDTSNLDLEKKGIFLRLRSGNKNVITLKEKIGDDKGVRARRETELEIQDIEAMKYILEKLGFNNYRIMEKYRINLQYKDTKLSLDELFFGTYLEIEGSEDKIKAVAKELGFNYADKILTTYWDILEEFNKNNKTNYKNIVFPKNYRTELFAYK